MKHWRSTRLLPIAAGLLALIALDAQAQIVTQSGYTAIYQGVSEESAVIQGSNGTHTAYVVQVDLDAPGISFTTTPLATGGTAGGSVETKSATVNQFMQSTGVQVAMNANLFTNCCSTTTSVNETLDGLAMSNGTLVSPDKTGWSDVLFTQGNQVSMVNGGTANLSGVHNAVAGFGGVYQNGVEVGSPTIAQAVVTSAYPRAMLGLSQNGKDLYMVTINAGGADKTGTTMAESLNLMTDIGAYDVVFMDEGGSTSMAIEGANGKPQELESPNTGAERYDGNALGVYAQPLTPVPLPPGLGLLGRDS